MTFLVRLIQPLRISSDILRASYSKMASGSEAPLDIDIEGNIFTVKQRIEAAFQKADPERGGRLPTLIAVSKTKPVSLLKRCYDAGQRDFGENYIQELEQKANDSMMLQDCPEIRWHFIGTIQKNKIAKLLNSIPNLHGVQTLTNKKQAEMANSRWRVEGRKLEVMVQVNTSGEEQKGGAEPEEAQNLADFILDECPNLKLSGFMTIGALAHSNKERGDGPNPDFLSLLETRRNFCTRRGKSVEELEVSMGMSGDFEEAIQMGATTVRIGSTIFGARAKKQ